MKFLHLNCISISLDSIESIRYTTELTTLINFKSGKHFYVSETLEKIIKEIQILIYEPRKD
jgi:uncharacterized protein YlzI (FlbEa/FlbD family)